MAFVLDNPLVAGRTELDDPTVTTASQFVSPATAAITTSVSSFAPTLTNGFVAQASRAESSVTSYVGGGVFGVGLVAQAGSSSVTTYYPGSEAKSGGLHAGASDADGDPISFQILTQPAFGTLFVEFNGAILYTPNRGFSGVDSFTWRPWAAGEAGNVATVTFNVEQQLVATGSAVEAEGYSPSITGGGLFGRATASAVDVTGYASVGLSAGFQPQTTLAQADVVVATPTLQGSLQAQLGEAGVSDFAPNLSAGWINRVSSGAPVDTVTYTGLLSKGLFARATLAALDVQAFAPVVLELSHGLESAALLGEVDVAGFPPTALISSLIAQRGDAGTVIGLLPNLSFDLPPLTWSRQPDPILTWDVRAHLPAGRILDRPTEDALLAYWASQGYRILSDAEIEAIVGMPLETPVMIKREFGTGLYPVQKMA